MTPHLTSAAFYFFLLPLFTAVTAIGVGVLFLACIEHWIPRPNKTGSTPARRRVPAPPAVPDGPVAAEDAVLHPCRAPIPAEPPRKPGLA